jgi:hypothetical protein
MLIASPPNFPADSNARLKTAMNNKILVTEDNAQIRCRATFLPEKSGYSAVSGFSGATDLEFGTSFIDREIFFNAIEPRGPS